MRTSASFSLDSVKDAGLLKWLASQSNVSKVVRDALYRAMGAESPQVYPSELLASIHRIEAELGELKALVDDRSFVRVEGPPETRVLTEGITHQIMTELSGDAAPPSQSIFVTGTEQVDSKKVPPVVLANLRKLRGKS